MSECMQFPDTWEEFEQAYGFEDKKEIYTNGSRLIQSFRVKQWLDHTAEPERTAKVENKWHWNCDPYDDSTSPTEAGYYRIIDEDGTEMTDYFFGEPRMTRIGIGYWATCEKTILAWSRLEVTDESD